MRRLGQDGVYLLLRRGAVIRLPHAGCQGQGAFLWWRGLLDLIPPRHLSCSCTASLRHGLNQVASKQHWPLQNITSATSIWVHSAGLCLSVGWRAREGEEEESKHLKVTAVIHRITSLLFILLLHYNSELFWVILWGWGHFNQVLLDSEIWHVALDFSSKKRDSKNGQNCVLRYLLVFSFQYGSPKK